DLQHVYAEPAACAEHRDHVGRHEPRLARDFERRRDGVAHHAGFGGMSAPVEPLGNGEEGACRQLDVLGIAAVDFAPDVTAEVIAQRLAIHAAPTTLAARQIEVRSYAIPGLHVPDAAADGDDLCGDLVPQYAWILEPEPACTRVMHRQ